MIDFYWVEWASSDGTGGMLCDWGCGVGALFGGAAGIIKFLTGGLV